MIRSSNGYIRCLVMFLVLHALHIYRAAHIMQCPRQYFTSKDLVNFRRSLPCFILRVIYILLTKGPWHHWPLSYCPMRPSMYGIHTTDSSQKPNMVWRFLCSWVAYLSSATYFVMVFLFMHDDIDFLVAFVCAFLRPGGQPPDAPAWFCRKTCVWAFLPG